MKNLVLAILGLGILLGVITGVGALTSWLMVDNGRYLLGIILLGTVLVKLFKKEFDL